MRVAMGFRLWLCGFMLCPSIALDSPQFLSIPLDSPQLPSKEAARLKAPGLKALQLQGFRRL